MANLVDIGSFQFIGTMDPETKEWYITFSMAVKGEEPVLAYLGPYDSEDQVVKLITQWSDLISRLLGQEDVLVEDVEVHPLVKAERQRTSN